MRKILLIIFTFLPYINSWAVCDGTDGICSVQAFDLDESRTIFAQNKSIAMMPASTLKILTLYMSHKHLASDFRFTTQASVKGGNLYIKFSGDPTLRSADLISLIKRATKGRKISRVYMDGSMFWPEEYSMGETVSMQKFCYGAPASIYAINGGCAPFELGRAGIKYIPLNRSEKVRLSFNAHRQKADEVCDLELLHRDSNHYEVSGCYKDQPPQKLLLNIPNPLAYARSIITDALGGRVHITLGKYQAGQKVYVHESPKLHVLVKSMMHESNNQIADALMKTMAFIHYNRAASWSDIAKFILQALPERLTAHDIRIYDGSGISIYNRLTSDFMIDLLREIYGDPELYALYTRTVPIMGERESTLANRTPPSGFRVQAKTGTLDYVSCLAGFASNGKKTYAFSIALNNHLGSTQDRKSDEDQILKSLFE